MIIDAHTHLGLESFIVKPIPDWKRLKPAFQVKMEMTPERLIQSMDESGISRSVVFPFPLEEMDSRQANSYVLEQSRRFPNRLIPFALLDEEPEHWVERGCFGFKQHFLLAPERFNAKKVYRSIEESGFPLVAHFSTGHALAEARAILNIAPSLKMIVAHMGRQVPNTGDGVLALVRELKSETTVCFETSTVHNSEIIREAAEIAGPERILFGSDFPFNTDTQAEPVGHEINMIRNAFSDEVTREMVFRTNVLKMTGEA